MGRGELELHELEVPSVALLPFAVGSFEGIGPLSLADFPHRHTFYEIVLVTTGTGWHVVDSQPWPIMPPHFGVVVPGQVHHWEDARGVEGSVLQLDRRRRSARFGGGAEGPVGRIQDPDGRAGSRCGVRLGQRAGRQGRQREAHQEAQRRTGTYAHGVPETL